jgi:hypothetical protein
VLAAMLLAITTIVLLRGTVPARIGSSLRGRARAPSPRTVRRPEPRKTPRERWKRPPIRDVTAEIVVELKEPPADMVERHPEREPVDVLQPKPETRPRRRKQAPTPLVTEESGGAPYGDAAAEARRAELRQRPEPVVFERRVERTSDVAAEAAPSEALELQLREVIKQRSAAASAARPEVGREIGAVHKRIETPRAETPELPLHMTLEEWHVVVNATPLDFPNRPGLFAELVAQLVTLIRRECACSAHEFERDVIVPLLETYGDATQQADRRMALVIVSAWAEVKPELVAAT